MRYGKCRVTIYILQHIGTLNYKMQTVSTSAKMAPESSKSSRVPIPLSFVESESLKAIAATEYRSASSMARIIYLLGMEQYLNKRGISSTGKSKAR